MKILLTHGYFLHEDEKELQIMKPYAPLGIQYISAYLEQQGYSNHIFDSTFSDFETLKKTITAQQPDVIGIYTNLMTKLNVLRIIRFIKEESGLRTQVVLGGPEVRNHKQQFLEHGADVIVFGEGEETMLELVRFFDSGKGALSEITGIAFQDEKQEVVVTAERELRRELDSLPLPARYQMPLQKYFDAWQLRHGQRVLSVSTMRGCPYDCKWCSRAVYGQSYRRRSPQAVVNEIKWLQAHYSFDLIWFVDDVFTINFPWLRDFAAELEKQQVTVRYEIITRADRMNEEIVQLLKRSGCFRVWIGAESGSQKIIDAMSRRVKVEQVRSMIQLTRKHGMEAGTFIMLGYPGETEADIVETMHHLKVSNPDLYTLTVAYPIKGTPLYTEVESKFIQQLPWASSTDRDIDFERPYSRRYYNFAIRWIYNEVALHKNKSFAKYPWLKAKATAARVGMMLTR